MRLFLWIIKYNCIFCANILIRLLQSLDQLLVF